MTDLDDRNGIQVSITARIYHKAHEVFATLGNPRQTARAACRCLINSSREGTNRRNRTRHCVLMDPESRLGTPRLNRSIDRSESVTCNLRYPRFGRFPLRLGLKDQSMDRNESPTWRRMVIVGNHQRSTAMQCTDDDLAR
jgi:hypothetical protein